MKVKKVKETMCRWVKDNAPHFPGLCAAHLAGSITAMADDMLFPKEKDVDLLLVFAPDSPALEPAGPFSNNLEFLHKGLMVEVGLKPVSDYRDASTVLSNPEIAYHFRRDSVLYDPQGKLESIQPLVKQEYCRRKWVRAQIEHERQGWDRVADMHRHIPPTAIATKIMMMGYAFTYLSAVLCVATLQLPKVSLVKMHEILSRYKRLDLYNAHLALFGFERINPELTRRLLVEAAEAFDLAARIRKTPHPFQHKLHPHLRPYFVDKCVKSLQAGHFHQATSYIMPFYIASCDVIIADGNGAEQAQYRQQQQVLLSILGSNSSEEQQVRWVRSRQLGEEFFALAHDIVASHPGMVD